MMRGEPMPEGARKRYFARENAMEDARRAQPRPSMTNAQKDPLRTAIERYAFHDLSSKLGASVGYGVVRTDAPSLDSVKRDLASGSKLEAQLYDTTKNTYGSDLLPSVADRVNYGGTDRALSSANPIYEPKRSAVLGYLN